MPRNHSTEIVSEVLALSSVGHSRRRVAEIVGIPVTSVQNICARFGVTPTAEKLAKAERLLEQVETLRGAIHTPGASIATGASVAERMAELAEEMAVLLKVGTNE